MSTSARPFETAFVSADWYIGSVSEMMKNFAGQYRVLLPDTYNKILERVVAEVYLHESTMHQHLLHIGDFEPIHEDPWWVRDEYKAALQPLIDLCVADSENPNIYVSKFQKEVTNDIDTLLANETAQAWIRVIYYGIGEV